MKIMNDISYIFKMVNKFVAIKYFILLQEVFYFNDSIQIKIKTKFNYSFLHNDNLQFITLYYYQYNEVLISITPFCTIH